MNRIIQKIICLIFLSTLLCSCRNYSVEETLNNKFLELYSEIYKAHKFKRYGPIESLTYEMYYNYGCVETIGFDLEGNIWCYKEVGSGFYAIDIYSKDKNKYTYYYKYTTCSEDYNEWYEKYVNDEEIYDDQQENIEIEAKNVFDKYYTLHFDTKRSVSLIMKNIKTMSEFDSESKLDDYDILEIGKYKNDFSYDAEPIEWCVIYKTNKEAFLLSKNILMKKQMNEIKNEAIYEETSLCKYLNSEFYDSAFSTYEKEIIINKNGCGKIFLLSDDDIRKYVNDVKKMISYPAPVFEDILAGKQYYDYWLRNGNYSSKSLFLNGDGAYQYTINTDVKGVRPAMWIKFD